MTTTPVKEKGSRLNWWQEKVPLISVLSSIFRKQKEKKFKKAK